MATGVDYATLTLAIDTEQSAFYDYASEYYYWEMKKNMMELRWKYASDKDVLMQPQSIRFLPPKNNKVASRRLVQNPEEL